MINYLKILIKRTRLYIFVFIFCIITFVITNISIYNGDTVFKDDNLSNQYDQEIFIWFNITIGMTLIFIIKKYIELYYRKSYLLKFILTVPIRRNYIIFSEMLFEIILFAGFLVILLLITLFFNMFYYHLPNINLSYLFLGSLWFNIFIVSIFTIIYSLDFVFTIKNKKINYIIKMAIAPYTLLLVIGSIFDNIILNIFKNSYYLITFIFISSLMYLFSVLLNIYAFQRIEIED